MVESRALRKRVAPWSRWRRSLETERLKTRVTIDHQGIAPRRVSAKLD